jgi:ArsR family transcriptional regulator, arsenate/arsenite/antimonite-responsive transcriptional repressor
LAAQLKALGEPARLAIIERLSGLQDSAVEPFCEYLQLSQPTVSQHLKVLRQAGVIEVAGASGPSTYYRLVPERINEIATVLAALCGKTGVARAA